MPMLHYLAGLEPMGDTDLPSVIERYVRARRRPGMMLLVSDLLSGDPEDLAARLRDLRARGWQTIVAHIVDAAELSPDAVFAGSNRGSPTELVDLESGERLRITPTNDVIARYEGAVAAWMEQIETVCAAEAAEYLRLDTAWPFQTVVLRLLYNRGLVA
jgi:hypothetical protein